MNYITADQFDQTRTAERINHGATFEGKSDPICSSVRLMDKKTKRKSYK